MTVVAPYVERPVLRGLPAALCGLDRCIVMGVLNVTPDSFSDGGQHLATAAAIAHGLRLAEEGADLLVLSWGGTFGPVHAGVRRVRGSGNRVAHAHLRWLNPFPANLGAVLKSYDRVLIPEMNLGQLSQLIRARYLVDAVGYNRVTGKPFRAGEIADAVEAMV